MTYQMNTTTGQQPPECRTGKDTNNHHPGFIVHVTGQDSYLVRVITRDIGHLESFVGSINHFGETRTSIVMSHPIPQRALNQLPEAGPQSHPSV
ncbi:Lrp/AsnC ligand binding domain-containing protein [Oceanospirillum sp. D5]|uniref:Lrp/AsnC ligand binding domain-containing protein n=1 Tax=Oceanospirillum sediminis TaxID=2760088 RepID=A0A839IU04_9GAMM|nr:Lrp/AsnC ligand binding domain-containing protein [Oceanospirillum sediminis]MBB1488142.1 Lrp/AsnC ligand binding domain-containing protein [Oceanospirillum sediminis]